MVTYGIRQSISNYIFGDGLAPFRNKDGLYGYIDKSGTVQIEPVFLAAGPFSEGLAAVGLSIDQSNRYLEIGFIDKTGFIGLRQGDLYPVDESDPNNFVLPFFKKGYAISKSHIDKRPILIDRAGFADLNIGLKEYLSDFNDDGLAVTFYRPPQPIPQKKMVYNSAGIPVSLTVDGTTLSLVDTVLDELRSMIYSRAFPSSLTEFTNTLSDGWYFYESPDDEQGNLFLEYDGTRFNKTLGPFNNGQISQFSNGYAVYKNCKDIIYKVDKSLTKVDGPLDSSWYDEILYITYVPNSPHATIIAANFSDSVILVNVLDIDSFDWLFTEPLTNNLLWMPYAETNAGLLYMWDSDMTNPTGAGLLIYNVVAPHHPIVKAFNATDPQEGFFCAQLTDSTAAYFDITGKLLTTFDM